MRSTRTRRTLKLHRETLHLLTDIDLARAATGAAQTGVTACPVGTTKLVCCTLKIPCA